MSVFDNEFIQTLAEEVVKRIGVPGERTEKLAFSVPETAAMLGLGCSTVKKMIKSRQLEVARFGSRTLVTRKSMQDLLDRNLV